MWRQNHRGQPLTDADGQVFKVGSTVVDDLFGEVMISRGAALSLSITGVKAGDEEEGQVRSRAAKEVLWTVLDGFKVADELLELNAIANKTPGEVRLAA